MKKFTFATKIFALVLAVLLVLSCCSDDSKKKHAGPTFTDEGITVGAVAQTVSTFSNKMQSVPVDNCRYDMSVEFNISDQAASYGNSPLSMISQSGLKSMKINGTGARNGSRMLFTADAYLNNNDIIGGEVCVDADDRMIYVTVPELNNSSLAFSFDELGLYGFSSMINSTTANPVPTFSVDLGAYFDQYVNELFNQIPDPQKSTKTLSFDGVTGNVDVYTFNISDKDALTAIKNVYEKMLKDARTKELVVDVLMSNGDALVGNTFTDRNQAGQYYDTYSQLALTYLNSELGRSGYSTKVFDVYVNNGSFAGFNVDDIGFEIISSGNNIVVVGKEDGDAEFYFKGQIINNVVSGSFFTDGEEIFTLKHFDVAKLEQGIIDAEILVSAPYEIKNFGADNMLISVYFDFDANNILNVSLNNANNQELLSYKVSVRASGNAPAITIPGNYTTNKNVWINGARTGLIGVINKLKNAGMNESIMELVL